MTNIAIEDLTTINVDGTGAFDSLMQATKNHLQEEYKAGRIKGAEYSQVYLGSLVAVMDQAVKFLEIQQQDKLIAAQIQEIEARKALIEVQRDNAIIEGQNLVLQGQLVTAQVDKTNADKDLVVAQLGLIPDQKAQMQAQTELIGQQRTNLIAEALNIPKQGALIDAQAAKTVKDGLIADEQIKIAKEDVLIKKQQVLIAVKELEISAAKLANIPKEGALLDAQAALTGQQHTNLVAEALNIPKQGQLIDKQVTLMGQKTKTEEAQIKDIVNGEPVLGVIGKQKTLYERQADGFLRDAEHKMAKLMTDVWAVQRTTDEGFAPSTQLANASIDSVITKAKQGVGV